MTGLSLYVLADQYKSLAEKLADLSLPDEAIADTLEGERGALEEKSVNVAMFVRNLESSAQQIKDAMAEMAKRVKAYEQRADHVRQYLLDNMTRCGITKIESPYFSLSIRANPESVVIGAIEEIPAEFMRQPPPPAPSPDKTAIKDAIKSGQDVPGAILKKSLRLEIK